MGWLFIVFLLMFYISEMLDGIKRNKQNKKPQKTHSTSPSYPRTIPANAKPKSDYIRGILLTASGKNNAACVTIYDLDSHKLVRLVSNAETAAGIPFYQLKNISALDIIVAEKVKTCPIGPQSENLLIRDGSIRKVGTYFGSIEDIRNNICYQDRLSFTHTGENRLAKANHFTHSLEIIPVENLVLKKVKKYDGSLTTRANFKYNGVQHSDYRVTDFTYKPSNMQENLKVIPYADLVVSIPKEPYIINETNHGYYKFIAAIFNIPSYPLPPIKEETMKKQLFSIGYSGFPDIDTFIDTLKQYGINIVIDVRSIPVSTYFDKYNKDYLHAALLQHNIHYRHYPENFGARQTELKYHKNGRLDFGLFAMSKPFNQGVERVEKSNGVIAFMCAEAHPADCHRAVLITRAFHSRGHEIIHILPDGKTASQKDVDEALLHKFFPNWNQHSLFDPSPKTKDEYILEAYVKENDEIGFRL